MEGNREDAAAILLDEASRAILNLANRQVRVRAPDGRRIRVTMFEARLLELATPDCKRRLMCQTFIEQVRGAVRRLETAGI